MSWNLVKIKIKSEKKRLQEEIKRLEFEPNFFKAQGQTEKGNVLEEFQALIVDPHLTGEEQNELYRTLIDYIQYIWANERVKIQIGIGESAWK